MIGGESLTLDDAENEICSDRLDLVTSGRVILANPDFVQRMQENENTNGLIRQYFPKGDDFTTITQGLIDRVIDKLNNRLRKYLGIKTPNQIFFGINPPVALVI